MKLLKEMLHSEKRKYLRTKPCGVPTNNGTVEVEDPLKEILKEQSKL